ncbi:MAG: hypothetical protein WA899_22840 [Candidatus Sulfotelmatobacter sp.]
MVEVRKLLEQQDAKKTYRFLTFHCDWALHAELDGTTAQEILKQFDAANIHLKKGVELEELPLELRLEVERISKMEYFERELERFMDANGIPTLKTIRADGWTHFLHLYAKIIEDCPLVMKARNNSATIASVTLQSDLGKAPAQYENAVPAAARSDMWFQVRWVIQDKDGRIGQIAVINSFSLNPLGRHAGVPPIDA